MSAPLPPMGSFQLVIAGLSAGDQEAARHIYQRFVNQMIRLAAQRLDRVRDAQADAESVAQSVFQSFFAGQRDGDYSLHNWGMVYGLLAHITVCKCLNRNRDLRRGKRDVAREVTFEDWQHAAQGPAVEDEVMLAELLDKALAGFDDDQRHAVKQYLDGRTVQQVATSVGLSSRTVERLLKRFKRSLLALLDSE